MKRIHWNTRNSRITLLPARGRVLQVEVAGVRAFWENPGWSGDWNIGGDRLWIGPEVRWFWKTRRRVDFTKYTIPAAVDPGRWRSHPTARPGCAMRQVTGLRHHLSGATVRLELTRRFEPVRAPTGFPAVAYTTDNALRVCRGAAGQVVDLWSLLQLPGGGVMHIPCRTTPRFRDYFSPIPPELWNIDGQVLQLDITGRHQYKIGIPAALTTGRIAYVRTVGHRIVVVIREFWPQSWRPYCDAPLHIPHQEGDAVQVYNDGGGFGGFGELEYHSPCIRADRTGCALVDGNLTTVIVLSARQWKRYGARWLKDGPLTLGRGIHKR